jgi:hypothetical protein
VRAFMIRSLLQEHTAFVLIPVAVIVISCGMIYMSGDPETALELLLFSLVLLTIFTASGWRMHLRTLREKVEAARARWPVARIYNEGIRIDGLGPAHLLEWERINDIWPAEGAWLLILDTKYFITLPVAAASQEALAFLHSQVSQQSLRRGQQAS